MSQIEVIITSPPDRTRAVAELYFKNRQIAEISKEDGTLRIALYPNLQEEMELELAVFLETINSAASAIE